MSKRASKTLSIHYNIPNSANFGAPSSTLGRDRHMRSQTFYMKFNFEQLLFETFFDVMRIFGSTELQSESNFSFL